LESCGYIANVFYPGMLKAMSLLDIPVFYSKF